MKVMNARASRLEAVTIFRLLRLELGSTSHHLTIRQRGRVVYERIVNEGEA